MSVQIGIQTLQGGEYNYIHTPQGDICVNPPCDCTGKLPLGGCTPENIAIYNPQPVAPQPPVYGPPPEPPGGAPFGFIPTETTTGGGTGGGIIPSDYTKYVPYVVIGGLAYLVFFHK